jgi:hypothetical protein
LYRMQFNHDREQHGLAITPAASALNSVSFVFPSLLDSRFLRRRI